LKYRNNQFLFHQGLSKKYPLLSISYAFGMNLAIQESDFGVVGGTAVPPGDRISRQVYLFVAGSCKRKP
jgi:hypothetical protein